MTEVEINGDTVTRSANEWTPTVHRYLRHLQDRGLSGVPRPLAIEAGKERVQFVRGTVGSYPLTPEVRSIEALETAAKLLRGLHDAGADFEGRDSDVWMLPPRSGADTICHGDFAPYNCAFDGRAAVGVIDFDTAHPAPRSWDIAYALYRFAPLTAAGNLDGFGDIREQGKRARLFCDAYDLEMSLRSLLPELVAERLTALADFMRGAASEGDETFKSNIQAGHLAIYLKDIEYVRRNSDRIRESLTS